MRLLSYFWTFLVQLRTWLKAEGSSSTAYASSRPSNSYGSSKAPSIPKRLKKFYGANMVESYITTIIAGGLTFSAGFTFSLYRLSLSPLCRHVSSPDCFNVTFLKLAAMNEPAHPINYVPYASAILSYVNFTINTGSLLLGLYIGCVLSNHYGRRKTMFISSIPNIFGWGLLFLFAVTKLSLFYFGAQALNALGAGIILISTTVYLVEVCGRKQFVYISCCIGFPMVTGFLLGWLVHIQHAPPMYYAYPKDASEIKVIEEAVEIFSDAWVHWSVYAAVGMVIAIVNIGAVCMLPESPYWLVQAGDFEGATAAMEVLKSKYDDTAKEIEEIKSSELSAQLIKCDNTVYSFIQYCLDKRRCSLIYAILLITLQQLGGANLILSYVDSLYGYSFGNGEHGATRTGYISCQFLLISWLLSKFFSHRTFLLVGIFMVAISSFSYTIFLGLFLNHYKTNHYAIYILWTYAASQSISAIQFLPLIQFTAGLSSSQMRSLGCFITFSIIIIVSYMASLLSIVISCYVLFLMFALANATALVVIIIFSYKM